LRTEPNGTERKKDGSGSLPKKRIHFTQGANMKMTEQDQTSLYQHIPMCVRALRTEILVIEKNRLSRIEGGFIDLDHRVQVMDMLDAEIKEVKDAIKLLQALSFRRKEQI